MRGDEEVQSALEKFARDYGQPLTRDQGAIELHAYLRPTGLDLDGVGYREWASIGSTLFYLYEWTPWAIGDWLEYGERTFGETYAQAVTVSGRSLRTLYNLRYIASRVPPERRVESLDVGHHDAVAPLPPEEQEWFLKEGERMDRESNGHLTVPAFREFVRENRETPKAERTSVRRRKCECCGGTGEIIEVKEVKPR